MSTVTIEPSKPAASHGTAGAAQNTRKVAAPPGKYLTFTLAAEDYGVPILKTREIIGMTDVTFVPQTRDFVRGVINLRGKVIPVLDLRVRFGLSRGEQTENTCIIVFDIAGALMGAVVDAVQEVIDFDSEHIAPPPRMSDGVDADFVLGMGLVDDRVKILLDIDAALAAEKFI